jgi:hypothetical protein
VNSATLRPSERIVRRLRSNDCPTPSPNFRPIGVHLFPFCDRMLTNPSDLKRSLYPIVKTVAEFSRFFSDRAPDMFADRVTRLGEFSPIGRLFTLGSFFHLQKLLGVIFSQSHLVTLFVEQKTPFSNLQSPT